MHQPVYLDNHATTPIDERVVAAMLPYLGKHFGNPASQGHVYGWEAAAAVKRSRQIIADAIHADPDTIIFTSGATEANNLAIKGVAEANFSRGKHLITVATEHSAVLEPCRYLEKLGFEVTYLPVDGQGLIDLEMLAAAIRADTILVSVMAANNEIGVLQPLAEIGAICRDRQVLFHTDAAQAVGKIPLDVAATDLLSLTAHKLYGPKGIGALYVRQRTAIAPQMHGGGQEQGLRSGTLATHQIVGMARAIELAMAEQESEAKRQQQLRDRLWSQLQTIEGVMLNGHPTQRLPGSLNISIKEAEGPALVRALRGKLAISTGSACASGRPEPSHVLLALGRDRQLATASLRFGIGRFNTPEEIDLAAALVREAVQG